MHFIEKLKWVKKVVKTLSVRQHAQMQLFDRGDSCCSCYGANSKSMLRTKLLFQRTDSCLRPHTHLLCLARDQGFVISAKHFGPAGFQVSLLRLQSCVPRCPTGWWGCSRQILRSPKCVRKSLGTTAALVRIWLISRQFK